MLKFHLLVVEAIRKRSFPTKKGDTERCKGRENNDRDVIQWYRNSLAFKSKKVSSSHFKEWHSSWKLVPAKYWGSKYDIWYSKILYSNNININYQTFYISFIMTQSRKCEQAMWTNDFIRRHLNIAMHTIHAWSVMIWMMTFKINLIKQLTYYKIIYKNHIVWKVSLISHL